MTGRRPQGGLPTPSEWWAAASSRERRDVLAATRLGGLMEGLSVYPPAGTISWYVPFRQRRIMRYLKEQGWAQ